MLFILLVLPLLPIAAPQEVPSDETATRHMPEPLSPNRFLQSNNDAPPLRPWTSGVPSASNIPSTRASEILQSSPVPTSIGSSEHHSNLPSLNQDVSFGISNRPTFNPPSYYPSVGPTLETEILSSSSKPSIAKSQLPTNPPSNDSVLSEAALVPSRAPTTNPSINPGGLSSKRPSVSASMTVQPSLLPSDSLGTVPTKSPSRAPSSTITSNLPAVVPSPAQTAEPALKSPKLPTPAPLLAPVSAPRLIPSLAPSSGPSFVLSDIPSQTPSDLAIFSQRFVPSSLPSVIPSSLPSVIVSSLPSDIPSSLASDFPRLMPTDRPSHSLALEPSILPSDTPSVVPTAIPSQIPSSLPSKLPSDMPSLVPTISSSQTPSLFPSKLPSDMPSWIPTGMPSQTPSLLPSTLPSDMPSLVPTGKPSQTPSLLPSELPSDMPSSIPTGRPSLSPTASPSSHPSLLPTSLPSTSPSQLPSMVPTKLPSSQPSLEPTFLPSAQPSLSPSLHPSAEPSDFPSDVPSSGPSLLPTSVPSTSPSSQPSSEPTSSPSLHPSSHPSGNPSLEPTSAPSMHPSTNPTAQPSSQPTSTPSASPSSKPSTQPSAPPSLQPSVIPTALPSLEPSSLPSKQPSANPTARPSLSPTSAPSSHPSTNPTTLPSSSPSSQPSSSPSSKPSGLPSLSPSNAPSRSPSMQPSDVPSTLPTFVPSTTPSISPTGLPTSLPSNSPSASPTITCHDKMSYQSPLNVNLRCEDHQGTECLNWHNLGLDAPQVFDLISSCPVSCNIPCESIGQIDWTLTITISNVNGTLQSDSTEAFEQVTEAFVRNILSSSRAEGEAFVLDPVSIVSQDVVENNRVRGLRNLQEQGNVRVRITFTLEGATLNVNTADVQESVLDGLDSDAYAQALQNTGDESLARIVVVKARVPAGVVDGSGDSKSPKAAVAGSVVSCVVFVGAVVGLMMFSRRKIKARTFHIETNHVFETIPENSISSPRRSPSASPTFELAADSFASKVVRSITSMNSQSDVERRETGPSSDTTSVSSESEEAEPHPFSGVVPPMIVIDDIDGDTDDSWRSKKVSHIVPGMQLRADSELVSAINDKTKPFDASVLTEFISKRVDSGQQSLTESQQLERGESFNVFSSDADEAEDADDDDYEYASSTDANDDAEVAKILTSPSNTEISQKGSAASDKDPTRAPTTSRYTSPSSKPSVKRPWSKVPSRPPRVPSDGSNSRESPMSNSGSPLDLDAPPIASSPQQQKGSSLVSLSPAAPARGNNVTTSAAPSPSLGAATSNNDAVSGQPPSTSSVPFRTRQVGILDSLWTRVAQKRAISDTSDGENTRSFRGKKEKIDAAARVRQSSIGANSHTRASSQANARLNIQMPPLSRASSYGSIHGTTSGPTPAPTHVRSNSQGSNHVRSSSRTSSASSGGGPSFSEDGTLETFEAPAKGKLGLLIEQQPFKGVVITKVKDYSPLLGQIMPGDRIVNVNGTRTDHLSLNDVLKIMSNGSKNWNGMIRITVLRPHNEGNVDQLRDPRFEHSFEGSSRAQDIMSMMDIGYDFDRIISHSNAASMEFFSNNNNINNNNTSNNNNNNDNMRHPPT
ncbi:hypothetical protein ACA910_009445 [Epithemia clementina (nom. ined.)]